MVSFGQVAGMGVVATMLTGGIVTVAVQPLMLSMIPATAWAVLLSWALAVVVGFIIASCVWALVVAAMMVTLFSETDDRIKSIR